MKFIKGLFAGLGIGLGVAVGLYVLAQAVDLIGCFFTCGNMACFTDESCVGRLGMYNTDVAIAIFGFCSIAGTIIGTIYGIAKQSQEMQEANKRKRNDYALDFKRKHDDTIRECGYHKNIIERKELQSNYSAVILQGNVWDALDDASTSLQKLDGIVNELKIKEGK